MKINIARSLILFGAIVAIGLAGSTGFSYYASEELKVNGPVYRDIINGKDLIADIVPSPLFVTESYMLANEMMAFPTISEQNIQRIGELKTLYDQRRNHWAETNFDSKLMTQLQGEVLTLGDKYWQLMQNDFLPAIDDLDMPTASVVLGNLYTSFHAQQAAVTDLIEKTNAYLAQTETNALEKDNLFSTLTLAASLLSIGIFLAGLFLFRRRAVVPLTAMKDYMQALSDGDYAREVPYAKRSDEIGDMAQSVAYFRKTAMERNAARDQSEAARREKEELDAATAARVAVEDAERVRVIEALTAGLENLSLGNLTYRIEDPFAPDYEKLRSEFNASIEQLNSTLEDIAVTTNSVRLSSCEIGDASEDLSQRTEQQAASLEETAAALDEITSTVKNSSLRAEEASQMVGAAKAGAEKSAKVVHNAIAAMEKIEDSSRQISQIISVIDDIAFQTNLLALNAGVEAARAGEAGRGFAVVAQEVRELAQRSANAAKEIKSLIQTSTTQVETGVSLVNETGTSLTAIETQVARINDHIQSIVTGARDQSNALAEINSSVNKMDQVIQQNAAMVEQTNAATQVLSGEAVKLEALVRRFKTSGAGHPSPVAASPASRPRQSPARALGAKVASAFGLGGAAAA